MRSFLVLFLIFVISQTNAGPVKPKAVPVQVGLFYNARDEASLNLLRAQNRTGVWDLMLPGRTELEMDFNPMGGASSTDGSYTCPNDENCHATKLHACAIKMHHDDDVTHHEIFYFILCTAIHDNWESDPDGTVVECVNEIGTWPDEGESIDLCAKNVSLSNEYLDEFLDDANSAGVKSVPWVQIDGEYNEGAASDLLGAVCSAFTENQPTECQGGSTGTTGTGATGTTSASSQGSSASTAEGGESTTPSGDGGGAADLICNKFFTITLLMLAIVAFK